MTISAFLHRFNPAEPDGCPPSGKARVRRFVARHLLTDEERKNLRDYYRCTPVQSPAITTAALGGHPQRDRGPQR